MALDGPLALNSSYQVYQVLLCFRIRIVFSLILREAVIWNRAVINIFDIFDILDGPIGKSE